MVVVRMWHGCLDWCAYRPMEQRKHTLAQEPARDMDETVTRKKAVGIIIQLIKQGVYRTNLMIISTLGSAPRTPWRNDDTRPLFLRTCRPTQCVVSDGTSATRGFRSTLWSLVNDKRWRMTMTERFFPPNKYHDIRSCLRWREWNNYVTKWFNHNWEFAKLHEIHKLSLAELSPIRWDYNKKITSLGISKYGIEQSAHAWTVMNWWRWSIKKIRIMYFNLFWRRPIR